MSRSVLEVLNEAQVLAEHHQEPDLAHDVDQAISTVERMAEALSGAMAQMEMAGDCIEARRYDEALLHVRSLDRQRREALAAYRGESA